MIHITIIIFNIIIIILLILTTNNKSEKPLSKKDQEKNQLNQIMKYEGQINSSNYIVCLKKTPTLLDNYEQLIADLLLVINNQKYILNDIYKYNIIEVYENQNISLKNTMHLDEETGKKLPIKTNHFALVGAKRIDSTTLLFFIIKDFRLIYYEPLKLYTPKEWRYLKDYKDYKGNYIGRITMIRQNIQYEYYTSEEKQLHRIDIKTLTDTIWARDTIENCQKALYHNSRSLLFPTDYNNYINIYISFNFSKKSYILLYYLLKNSDTAVIIDDIVKTEDLNFRFSIHKNRFDIIKNVYIMGTGDNKGLNDQYSLRGYSTNLLLRFFLLDNIRKKFLEEQYGKKYCDTIARINIELRDSLQYNDSEYTDFLKDRCSNDIGYLPDYYKELYSIQWNEKQIKRKELLDYVYSELIEKNGIKIRWKNEAEMYRIIKYVFSDATYQYRSDFLENQSIDVYVPSKKLAFEYQGLQHFKAVNFFGGESTLKQNIIRDSKKKQKCVENGIILIEWFYYEPVTIDVLRKKLSNICSIDNISNNNNYKQNKESDFLYSELLKLPHINVKDLNQYEKK